MEKKKKKWCHEKFILIQMTKNKIGNEKNSECRKKLWSAKRDCLQNVLFGSGSPKSIFTSKGPNFYSYQIRANIQTKEKEMGFTPISLKKGYKCNHNLGFNFSRVFLPAPSKFLLHLQTFFKFSKISLTI